MTIAVIKTGGKQYKVTEGQQIKIEKIEGEKGADVCFDQVLLISDDKAGKVELGQPTIKSEVKAEILEQGRSKKVEIIKFKRKVRYRRKAGHRQPFTKILIKKI